MFCCVHSNDFSKMVAEEYLNLFEFTDMTLDQSLRYISSQVVIIQLLCHHTVSVCVSAGLAMYKMWLIWLYVYSL